MTKAIYNTDGTPATFDLDDKIESDALRKSIKEQLNLAKLTDDEIKSEEKRIANKNEIKLEKKYYGDIHTEKEFDNIYNEGGEGYNPYR